ncbi:MAG: right-handed parallel beta-helix repeat-containing protein [Treponema sp.]|nr:right-handed parallel beta-helix repeat-containing protein [Treponema sp.]
MKRMRLLAFALFLLSGIMLHAQQSHPGLYADDDGFLGNMDLYDAFEWLSANAQDGGNYTVVLESDLAASSSVLDYNGKSVTVSLKSSGADVQVTYATRSPSSSLFTVKAGVTFVLEKGVALVGRPSASRPPVTVNGGNFIMNGGAVKDSKVDNSSWFGGGVDLLRGTFTMNDGVISGNSCHGGAGVCVGKDATFIMNGGTISGNSGRIYNQKNGVGGGVYVNGTFTMSGGIITRNSCSSRHEIHRWHGGGVYVSKTGTFVMQGGKISDNSECGVYVGNYTDFMHSESGKFTMSGGIITGNASGGVHVTGIFIMDSGTISKNTAEEGAGVYVTGTFTMNDGEIIENTLNDPSRGCGGGVYTSSIFTMNGGVISKNRASGYGVRGGGGVFVSKGSFTMNNGIISGNSTTRSGGGVLVDSGTFIKSNMAGIIYGVDAAEDKANKADQYGHAVYTKNGSRDTTARATMALDSKKYGAEGGWE